MHVARFCIDSASRPRVTDALCVAEAARYCLMGVYGRLTMREGVKGRSPIFSGKSADGSRLLSHTHCHYLPTDEDGDGRIDRLTLYASGGFGTAELEALLRLRFLKPRDHGASHISWHATFVGVGNVSDFRVGPLQLSRCWVSTTPFLAPDHPKLRGRWRDTERGGSDPSRFLVAQVRKELSRWLDRNGMDFPKESIRVDLLMDERGNSRRLDPRTGRFRERALQFRRKRWKRSDDGERRLAGFFKVEFPREVPGPLTLGYSSHFGMGLFLPID